MDNPLNAIDYAGRIKSAVDFIEDNLSGELSARQVAAHTGFSEYHFHRIFSAMLGESVSEYIRRRRLSRAAATIVKDGRSILDAALDAGYDSQEAFTRAFKSMFGVTPGRLVRGGVKAPVVEKKRATLEMIEHLKGGITMEPKFVERAGETLIGMGGSFKEGSFEAIGRLWDRFNLRENEIQNIAGDYALGICCSKHDQIPIQPGDSMVYIAARPVKSSQPLPEGMVAVQLPATRYAVFTHSGPLSNLMHTINYIWGTWLPRSSYKHSESFDFELYDERFNPDTMDGEVDIYIPIG